MEAAQTKTNQKPPHRDLKQIGKAVKRIFAYEIKYAPVAFFVSFLCIIISAVANVSASMFIASVIDNYVTPQLEGLIAGTLTTPDFSQLGIACGMMAIVLVIGITASYFYNYLMAYVAQKSQMAIRNDLFTHMQNLPVSYFDQRTTGDIMSIYTNDVDTLREAVSRSWPAVVNSVVTVIAVTIAMFIMNWLLAITTLVLCIPIIFAAKGLASKSGKYFVAQQITLGKTNGYVEEMITGQRVVKVFNYEEEAERKFNEINDRLCVENTRANRYANILMPTVNQIGNVVFIILAVVGAVLTYYSENLMFIGVNTTIGVIIAFLNLCRSFTQPIGNMAQQTNSIIMAFAGARRIFELIDSPLEQDNGYVRLVNAKEGPDGNPIPVPERTGKWAWEHPHTDGSKTTYTWLRGKINFYDVDFGYVPNKIVLHNITLYAEPGQKVAFVGPTGAGKTTITNLINRFYDIADGKIRYDDININKIKKADLRRSLGMVLQDTELFTGTVKDNIKFGKLDATDEEVIEAAKLANAHRFIMQLPNGYDTMLVKAGTNLSQGQRQLIAIARCAIANPPVMILDEATSSIDSRTEEMVQQGMDAIMKGRTVFVIAHRLSTVKNSDVIMVIDGGRIIERGSHEELLAKKGKYYQLYTGNAIK